MMDLDILGEILNTMYDNSSEENKILNIHIFGIRYGEKIKREGYSVDEIIEKSGIDYLLKARLIEGINLSDYVDIVNR